MNLAILLIILFFIGNQPFQDEVIDFYFCMINSRNMQRPDWPNVYSFGTNFDPFIHKSSSQQDNSFGSINLFAHDLAFMPIKSKMSSHWSLVVIDMRKRFIYLYTTKESLDCKYTVQEDVRKRIRNYQSTLPEHTEGFTIVKPLQMPVEPHKHNNPDSGVFVCVCAEYLSRNECPIFEEDRIKFYREKLLYDIMNKNIVEFNE